MLHTGSAIVADNHSVVEMIPSSCSAANASECGAKETWVRRCGAAIAAKDSSISADDLLDLATMLWDRPGCQRTCPKFTVDLLFSDRLTILR